MVAIMKGPRAKKFNKFKKRNNKHKVPLGKPQNEAPRELPKSDMEAKVHLITQDIKFALALGGNDKKIRDKFLKNLKKWLNTRSNTSFPFSDQDFLRLWKGLFYCMWMSDKPLIQEQLCEDMGSLFYCFDNPAIAVQFYGRFLETISQEWLGIDHWRLDKFMMLVRRVTRHLFHVMQKHEWNADLLKCLRKEITGTVFKEGTLSFGCTMHFLSIFWEEVSKVTEGKVSTKAVTGLIRPFLSFLADTNDHRLSKRVVVDIFYGLLKQSDLGRQHEEKYEVWKQFGFPSERIDDLELVREEEDADEEGDETEEDVDDVEEGKDGDESEAIKEKIGLDPRAGNVSVELPEIPFNARKIHQLMEKTIYDAGTRSTNRKIIKKIMFNYEKFIAGNYPLGVQKVKLPQTEAAKLPNIDEKIQELESLEENLLEDTRLMKKLSKAEKKRFYKSGQTPKEFLKTIGRFNNGTTEEEADDLEMNGMEVEDEEQQEAEDDEPKKKKKRKSGDQNEDGNKKKKKKEDLNSSIELDNGFEVEDTIGDQVTQDDEEKTVESPKQKKEKKKVKQPPTNGVFSVDKEWDKPLEEGEVEYFITPTKQRLKHLNVEMDDVPVNSANGKDKLLKNPFAANGNGTPTKKLKKMLKNSLAGPPESPKTPVNKLTASTSHLSTPNSSGKRVKIMLERNMAQEKSEYFRQLRNSPQIPFDSNKKPSKGLLKPHSMPSPINPYYKKKIGLKLDNE